MGIKPVGVGDDLPDAGGAGVKTAIEMLNGHRSWKLERISPTSAGLAPGGDIQPPSLRRYTMAVLSLEVG